jgi:Domain of unknown function (DUF4234)
VHEEVGAIAPRETRPVGRPRGVGFGILLFVVTLGFYGWYWAFKTHEELKRRTGEGLGGVLGLVVWILLSGVLPFVSAFVIPSEIGAMYRREAQDPPVTGWTGLWLVPGGILVIPAIIWFVKVQGALNRFWTAKGARPRSA